MALRKIKELIREMVFENQTDEHEYAAVMANLVLDVEKWQIYENALEKTAKISQDYDAKIQEKKHCRLHYRQFLTQIAENRNFCKNFYNSDSFNRLKSGGFLSAPCAAGALQCASPHTAPTKSRRPASASCLITRN